MTAVIRKYSGRLRFGVNRVIDEDHEAEAGASLQRAPAPSSTVSRTTRTKTFASRAVAGEIRVHRRDRLGGVVHEYVLAA